MSYIGFKEKPEDIALFMKDLGFTHDYSMPVEGHTTHEYSYSSGESRRLASVKFLYSDGLSDWARELWDKHHPEVNIVADGVVGAPFMGRPPLGIEHDREKLEETIQCLSQHYEVIIGDFKTPLENPIHLVLV